MDHDAADTAVLIALAVTEIDIDNAASTFDRLDYTIVRPGGLKATPPSGKLVVGKENTLNSGEVSR
jgi:hypothetical protein